MSTTNRIIFNKDFINFSLILLIPSSLVTGVFLPNLILTIFIIFNLIFNIKNLKNQFLENKNIYYIFLLFSILIILSSLLSKNIYHSLESSFLYFLFLIYLLSIIITFKKENYKLYFLYLGIIFLFIISCDAIYELINGKNILGFFSIEGRIAGLFNDRWLLGRYLIYLLPLFIGIFSIEYNKIEKKFKIFSIFTFILSFIVIVFSGERSAFLLLIFYFLLLAVYLFRKFSFKYSFSILIFLLLIIILPFFNPESNARLQNNIVLYLTSLDLDQNQYLALWSTSMKIFIDNPFFGSGPNNFRIYCQEDIYNLSMWSCSTHPHNIIIQLLSEIGIIGSTFVFSAFIFISYKAFAIIRLRESNFLLFGYYSILSSLIIQLFPFIISGNFFLSWYGIILYLTLSFLFIYKKDMTKFFIN